MNDTVAKALAALLVAAVSGLTFIAYRHPKSFSALSNRLHILIMGAIFCEASFNLGIWAALKVISQPNALPPDILSGVERPLLDSQLSWWFAVWGFIFLFYLFFLETLPRWLLKEKPEKQERDRE